MNTDAQGIIDNITTMIFQPIVSLLFAVGFLIFIWGLVEFIANPTDPTRKAKGTQHMIYGILGLLIMVSIWGIVDIVKEVLGIDCSGLGGENSKPCE